MSAPPASMTRAEPLAGESIHRGEARRPVLAPLRAAGGVAAYYALLALFGIASFGWSLIAALLERLLPGRAGERLGRSVIAAGLRSFLAAARWSGVLVCDVSALDALAGAEPLVIAPNHPSLLDAPLVISRLPGTVCAAKAPLWDNLLLGGAVRLAGYVRNDSPTRLVREAVRRARGGRHFLIFPEGTRSASLGAFKGGFALIAKHAPAPVQTLFIETNARSLGRGWRLLKRPPLPLVYRLRLGRRIAIEGDVHEAVERLHRYFRQELGAGGP